MNGYYLEKLSAQRLEKCYSIALPRVQRYFTKELEHVINQIAPHHRVLDLGCGYGRTLAALGDNGAVVIGIDNSYSSLTLARNKVPGCRVATMNALHLGFADNSFDIVCCIQNGISAFHVDQKGLLEEAVRVTKPNGIALFATYSDKFWQHRLHWFKMQADEGLLGELDMEKTGRGTIICKDGFSARTITPSQFKELCCGLPAKIEIREVDESSLFCQLTPY